MKTCGDVDPLITPYVDGTATVPERTQVETHLAACPVCQSRAAAERAVHDVLRARADRIREAASPGLRDRCRSAAREPEAAGGHRRAWVPWSLAASLVLAVAGLLFYGMTNRLEAALAAQLAMDHLKCFTMASAAAERPGPGDVEEQLRARFDWDIDLPKETMAVDLELVGGRRCLYGDGALAHVLYRRAGRPVSLFVLQASHSDRIFEIMGHRAVMWSKDGRTYALVAQEPSGMMTELAAYMAPRVR